MPALQSLQATVAASQAAPGAHTMQAEEPVLAVCESSGQASHVSLAPTENVSMGHRLDDVLPGRTGLLPAVATEHVGDPFSLEYVVAKPVSLTI